MSLTPRHSGSRKTGRRSPLVATALLIVGLLTTGGVYALFTQAATAENTQTQAAASTDKGEKLFLANCASCHGLNAEGTDDGPSLIGVGAASVDFQVGTGRMPMAFQGPQAERKPPQFTQEDIDALSAYVASLGPGPALPEEQYLTGDPEQWDVAHGAELFRINCAMCHNVAGSGGALTQGKFAPSLMGVEERHIYAAMVIGPQNMPVFNDANLTPSDKADIIAYLKFIENNPSVGGLDLGSLGPVSEGLFVWIFALGALIAIAVWLTARSN